MRSSESRSSSRREAPASAAALGTTRVFLREGGNHTVYVNRTAKRVSTIPRHSDINEDLARKICKDLRVPRPDV